MDFIILVLRFCSFFVFKFHIQGVSKISLSWFDFFFYNKNRFFVEKWSFSIIRIFLDYMKFCWHNFWIVLLILILNSNFSITGMKKPNIEIDKCKTGILKTLEIFKAEKIYKIFEKRDNHRKCENFCSSRNFH